MGSIFEQVFDCKFMMNPSVFYFNPTCELAVANGSFSYMPPLLLQEMESDLSTLPFIFGNSSDYVLTDHRPAPEFILKLEDSGFVLPHFISFSELDTLPDHAIQSIQPWGWSPAVHFKFKNIKEKCGDEFKQSPIFDWKNEHRLMFERKTSLEFLKNITDKVSPDWFIRNSMRGEIVYSCREIEDKLMQLGKIVLKSPMSSSGRGVQIIRQQKLNESNKQWISGILKQQKYLVAEPFLEKILDLSFQFQVISQSDIKFLGHSIFETNSNGQYRGTIIRPDLQHILPELNSNKIKEMIELSAKLILGELRDSVYSTYYQGFLGVDSMLFKDDDTIRIQPCIEINSRLNMGILTLMLEKHIHADAMGKFELFYGKQGGFCDFSKQQSINKPIELKDGKLYRGFLPLVEPTPAKKFGAYIDLGFAR